MNTLLIEEYLLHDTEHTKKSITLFNHILNAHNIWNNRIVQKQSYGVWQEHPISSFSEINMENTELSLVILDRYALDEKVEYTNSIGNTFTNSIHDILFHVINHSTYHRGQIAMLSRSADLHPVVSDYIFYKREN